MSQIQTILEKTKGTAAYEILTKMEAVYQRINEEQEKWYKATDFLCISGCGQCCENFEPDLFEYEALYMAAWLLENQYETALKVLERGFPFKRPAGCQFYNPQSPYHCSIYGGRPFVCRFFGACCSYSKTGEKVWKPCKFYPSTALAAHEPPLEHRQYTGSEIVSALGAIPPAMSDFMQDTLSFDSEHTELIRDILPSKIRWLLWIMEMNDNPQSPDTPAAA